MKAKVSVDKNSINSLEAHDMMCFVTDALYSHTLHITNLCMTISNVNFQSNFLLMTFGITVINSAVQHLTFDSPL